MEGVSSGRLLRLESFLVLDEDAIILFFRQRSRETKRLWNVTLEKRQPVLCLRLKNLSESRCRQWREGAGRGRARKPAMQTTFISQFLGRKQKSTCRDAISFSFFLSRFLFVPFFIFYCWIDRCRRRIWGFRRIAACVATPRSFKLGWGDPNSESFHFRLRRSVPTLVVCLMNTTYSVLDPFSSIVPK